MNPTLHLLSPRLPQTAATAPRSTALSLPSVDAPWLYARAYATAAVRSLLVERSTTR